ncbi:hypothetical protein Pmani_012970 [Petrolisthes manimaculis]|uniref:STI1/HOP DP domain-containing protein n=1 Tax=Petrolisthes manimaculis TaxID=1843537 RepID=A0AAE1U9S5_9EUCA|nr:hypothetical protein Pmani_012970 [Petrolisthes manimaculis]
MADQVPPLEDVPEVLEKIQKAEKGQNVTHEGKTLNSVNEEHAKKIKTGEEDEGGCKDDIKVNGGDGKEEEKDIKEMEDGGMKEAKVESRVDKPTERQKHQSSTTGFGGMKKGFLFGGGAGKEPRTKKTMSKAANDIPMIRAQPEKSSLVLKEVQEAMDANNAMEFQDQLAKRLETNPKVADVLADPGWIPILDELQRDPEATLAKYGRDPAIRETLRELCNVLGDTFLHISSEESGSDKNQEESKYAETPGVPEALADPFVKKMMTHMKAGDNVEVQRCVQSANPSQRKRIKTLIDVGLFKFSM